MALSSGLLKNQTRALGKSTRRVPRLTHSYLLKHLNYNPNTGIFIWKTSGRGRRRTIGDQAGHLHSAGYIIIGLNSELFKAHRLAWFYVYGKWPTALLDHVDSNKSNNRIKNLREATYGDNAKNRLTSGKISSSKYKGVHWNKKNKIWRAQITIGYKQHHLGCFENEVDAARAYNVTAKKLFGEFACVNRLS